MYQFNEEVGVCTRTPLGGGAAVSSLPLHVAKGAADSDAVMATFACGDTHEVPGLTVARLRVFLGKSAQTNGAGVLFEGTHKVLKHRVTLQQKVDRPLLLVLNEQSRQILQLRLDKVGPVADQTRHLPRDSPTLQAGLAVMVPIAKQYCDDVLRRSDLTAARERALGDAGKPTTVAEEQGKARG